MSWVCVAAAASSVIGAALSNKEAKLAKPDLPPQIKVTGPAKCESCGSTKWLFHNNARICAYCRSGQ